MILRDLKELIEMSDAEFYEKHLKDLSLEEQAAFLKEFPEFMEEGPLEKEIKSDEIYQKICYVIQNQKKGS